MFYNPITASAVTKYSSHSLPMNQLLLNKTILGQESRLNWAGSSVPRSSGTVEGGGGCGAIILAALVEGWGSEHQACSSLAASSLLSWRQPQWFNAPAAHRSPLFGHFGEANLSLFSQLEPDNMPRLITLMLFTATDEVGSLHTLRLESLKLLFQPLHK